MDITSLEPAAVWRNFADICKIPHSSGNEKQLSCFLAEKLKKAGFSVKQDALYNLRAERPDQIPGAPRIILQGHLDMVPQAAPGKEFDFLRDPITPIVEGDRVRADGTTLGADDGIGVAIALALLEDKEVRGNLICLFTVNEEEGLIGASALAPEFLDGDYLINLDNGESSQICIGCAGGIRLAFDFETGTAAAPAGEAVEITLSGLPGGHSGTCIAEKRGNALQMLARIVRGTGLAISSFDGGTVDNAIPNAARITGILADAGEKALLYQAAKEMKKELDPAFTLRLDIRETAAPSRVWSKAFQKLFLDVFSTLPNGVAEFAPAYGVPLTSSNLAVLKSSGNKLHLVISARSLDDDKRKIHTDDLQKKLSVLSPEVTVNAAYPGWKPDPESVLPGMMIRLRESMTGKKTQAQVIHAGLETGLFAGKNPRLQMISTSPDDFDIHTFRESVSISALQEFYPVIRALLNELAAN
ncbi:MAG: beta-Ala-His dipeptidase [Lentisphaeria bacterium]|nr:beta-Ala-His dipeptidase [Lentisphaeria bacterium]